jgi:hypothetical protein
VETSQGVYGLVSPVAGRLPDGAYLSHNNRQIMSLAPEDRQGSASGILRLFFTWKNPSVSP